MNFLNVYIHEGRLFVCFVPLVHETYQFGLLAMHCYTFVATCFGTSIKTTTIFDNDDSPLFYPSCSHEIKHHINQLWALHCTCKESCTKSKDFFFFLCYFNLIFNSQSFYHLFNEHNNNYSNLLQSFCKSLDKLLIQHASKF